MNRSESILPVQIQKIHIAKSQLGLSDDVYREILSQYNTADQKPVTSAKQLTRAQADILIESFKKHLGWREKRNGKVLRYDELSGREYRFATPAQLRKIEALWMKHSREKTVESLNNYIQRILKISSIKWILRRDVARLVKSITSLSRTGASPRKQNGGGQKAVFETVSVDAEKMNDLPF